MPTELPESKESLFTLAAPPLVWAAHFLVSYCTVAIYCVKRVGPSVSLGPARVAIGIYTIVALAAVTFFGVRSYRRHYARGTAPLHDRDSPSGQHRFLAFTTLLLAALSALAIGYAALTVVFVRSCR